MTTGAVGFVIALLAGVFAGVVSDTVEAVVVVVAAVVVVLVLFWVDVLFSFELFTVELLLLLFACVKLPLITFRGNGFGLIISTKKKHKNKWVSK